MWLRVAFSEGKKLTRSAAKAASLKRAQAARRRWFDQALFSAISRKCSTRFMRLLQSLAPAAPGGNIRFRGAAGNPISSWPVNSVLAEGLGDETLPVSGDAAAERLRRAPNAAACPAAADCR